jgi:hypothetical protein
MIVPRHAPDSNDERFCRAFLLQYCPFRSEDDFLVARSSGQRISWCTALQNALEHNMQLAAVLRLLKTSNDVDKDIQITQRNELESAQDDIDHSFLDDSDSDQEVEAPKEEDDGEGMSHPLDNCDDDLVVVNTPAENKQLQPTRFHYSRDDFQSFLTFIKHEERIFKQKLSSIYEKNRLTTVTGYKPFVLSDSLWETYEKLSQQQRTGFELVISIFEKSREPQWLELLEKDPSFSQIIVSGAAGSGKTFLIAAIEQYVKEHSTPPHASESEGRCIKTATTGIAATSINGHTIHRALGLSDKDRSCNLYVKNPQSLKRLHQFWQDALCVILDEYSMLSLQLLSTMNTRLNQIFGISAASRVRFGGKVVIFTGDLHQIPPVGGTPLYKFTDCSKAIKGIGDSVWSEIKHVVMLTQSQRQAGDNTFLALLTRVSKGKATLQDLQTITSRAHGRAGIDVHQDPWSTAMHIFPTNAEVAAHNKQQLTRHGRELITLWAQHLPSASMRLESITSEVRKELLQPKSKRLKGATYYNEKNSEALSPVVQLTIGTPVMLTKNLSVQLGLVNGAVGTVHDVLFPPGSQFVPLTRQDVAEDDSKIVFPLILVQFSENIYKGRSCTSRAPCVVPIPVTTTTVQFQGRAFIRKQFPLKPAFGVTIHKCQGLTLDRIVVSLSRTFVRSQAYVALSRVRKFTDLALFSENVTLNDINRSKGNDMEIMLNEVNRLTTLSKETEMKTATLPRLLKSQNAPNSSKQYILMHTGTPSLSTTTSLPTVGTSLQQTPYISPNSMSLITSSSSSSSSNNVQSHVNNHLPGCLCEAKYSQHLQQFHLTDAQKLYYQLLRYICAPWCANDCLPMSFSYVLAGPILRHQAFWNSDERKDTPTALVVRNVVKIFKQLLAKQNFLEARTKIYEFLNRGSRQRSGRAEYVSGAFCISRFFFSDLFQLKATDDDQNPTSMQHADGLTLTMECKCWNPCCRLQFVSSVFALDIHLSTDAMQEYGLLHNDHPFTGDNTNEPRWTVQQFLNSVTRPCVPSDSQIAANTKGRGTRFHSGKWCPGCKRPSAFPARIKHPLPRTIIIHLPNGPRFAQRCAHICPIVQVDDQQYQLAGLLYHGGRHFWADFSPPVANTPLRPFFRYDPFSQGHHVTLQNYNSFGSANQVASAGNLPSCDSIAGQSLMPHNQTTCLKKDVAAIVYELQ